jgi:hypothetical protein
MKNESQIKSYKKSWQLLIDARDKRVKGEHSFVKYLVTENNVAQYEVNEKKRE